MSKAKFKTLIDFMNRIPAIEKSIASGFYEDNTWWVKFSINIEHPLAWQVVQEIGYVANYISVSERLPTRFYPVSPPPYMNGGPKDFLSWIIESTSLDFPPNTLKKWLEGRMPRPVDDLEQWNMDDDDDEDDNDESEN
jgi:hypothetical protein